MTLGDVTFGAGREAVALLCCQGTLWARAHLAALTQALFCKAASWAVRAQAESEGAGSLHSTCSLDLK